MGKKDPDSSQPKPAAAVADPLIDDMVSIGYTVQAASAVIRNKGGSYRIRAIFEYCKTRHTSNHKAMMNQIIAEGSFQPDAHANQADPVYGDGRSLAARMAEIDKICGVA